MRISDWSSDVCSSDLDDGEDVLTAIENQTFDAVIIDLHVPGASGVEIMKQTRFMDAGRKRTPFIVLTADATSEARRERSEEQTSELQSLMRTSYAVFCFKNKQITQSTHLSHLMT